MTTNEENLHNQLKSMIESYDIAMSVLKDSVAGVVVRGAFIFTINNARNLVAEVEKK
jgi:hypothetical protein